VKELLAAGADVHGKIGENTARSLGVAWSVRFVAAAVGYGRVASHASCVCLVALETARRRACVAAPLWLCSDTVLHLASWNGHTATAKALVAAGADVNCQNSAGYASGRGLRRLSAALSLRRAELVSVGLCDAGTCCMCRRTALHHASEKGHTETARALVESGADVHAKDTQGYGRPLHCERRALAFSRMVRFEHMPFVQEDGTASCIRRRPH
jgi:hypothetical protein